MHVIRMPEHCGALSPILPVVPLRLAAEHDWIVLEVDGQHGGGRR